MIVARPTELKFVLNKDKHSVGYAEDGQKITANPSGGLVHEGNLPAFIAGTYEEAKRHFQKELGETLATRCYRKFDATDFRFVLSYTEVTEGSFWMHLNTTQDGEVTPVNP